MSTRDEPQISAAHVTKTFGPVVAVDDVSLDIYANEVLGIVGDNGAGKSTFLSLLTGYHHPDRGEFRYRGQPVTPGSPANTRRRLGIEMVYQDLAMAPDLAVYENLFLGEERHRFGVLLDRGRMRADAARVLEEMGSKVKPEDRVAGLSGGETQLVAIARGLLFDRDVILLDEPTAAISAAKADDVLHTIAELRERGKTIVLISHRLEDILEVCTRVAVFVTGRVEHVVEVEGLELDDLLRMMFGGRVGDGRHDNGDHRGNGR